MTERPDAGDPPARNGQGAADLGTPDELPTMPPPPRARQPGLRWATSPRAAPRATRPVTPPHQAFASVAPTRQLPPVRVSPSARVTPSAPGESPHRRPVYLFVALAAALAAVVAASLVLTFSSGREGHVKASKPLALLSPPLAFEDALRSLSGANEEAGRIVAAGCQVSSPASPARQALVSQLTGLVNADSALLSDLVSARSRLSAWSGLLFTRTSGLTQASLVAIVDYRTWLQDLQATGCYSAPGNNLNYEQAQKAASAEGKDAREVSSVWGPVARRHHFHPATISPL